MLYGLNLYGLNKSKEKIKETKKVILFESEKSPMLFCSYFGEENNITAAVCGSSISNYQFKLLLELGIEELIIAFDRQYKEANSYDKEWCTWTKKLKDLNNKYSPFVHVSFIFDKEHRLEYKMSPIDNGPEIFKELFKERITL